MACRFALDQTAARSYYIVVGGAMPRQTKEPSMTSPARTASPALTEHQARVAVILYARTHGCKVRWEAADSAHLPVRERSTVHFAGGRTSGVACHGKLTLVVRPRRLGHVQATADELAHEVTHALTDGGDDSNIEGRDPEFCRTERRLAYLRGGYQEVLWAVYRHRDSADETYDASDDRDYDRAKAWSARHSRRAAKIRARLATPAE